MKELIKLFNVLNEHEITVENYGIETNRVIVINGEMVFYKSTICGIDKFVITYIEEKINEITFFLADKNITLLEFKKVYGDCTFAYNFRDNISALSFLQYAGYKKVNYIKIEYVGNFNIEDDYIISNVVFKMKELE